MPWLTHRWSKQRSLLPTRPQGRILAAVGNARVEDLDANKVNLWLDEVQVARNGGRACRVQRRGWRARDGQAGNHGAH